MTNNSADNKSDEGRERYAPCADTKTVKMSRPDDLVDELLPGIRNDIAWQVIAPKLSGTDVNTLSLVSQGWQEAVHGRWVYDAKVRSHATGTFVVVLSTKDQDYKLRLYPLNGNSTYDLPPVPCPDFGNFRGYKCIALDGKIYILGGADDTGLVPSYSSRTMFRLDLAGHKMWKQCSSMQVGRRSFGTAVFDEKIYVIGGYSNGRSVSKCEVYDPKVDGWSSMRDVLIPWKLGDRVAAMGGELFVYGALRWRADGDNQSYTSVYNPITNEWRQLQPHDGYQDRNPWNNAFLAKGKFYAWTMDGIDVYDKDKNSWTNLHLLRTKFRFLGMYTWELDDEIVTEEFNYPRISLVQSRRFGHKNGQISFEPMRNSCLRSDLDNSSWMLSWNHKFCLIKL